MTLDLKNIKGRIDGLDCLGPKEARELVERLESAETALRHFVKHDAPTVARSEAVAHFRRFGP